ncbi:MAG: hypothetical protein LUO91_06950, partial [Methanomicrobiales archaeon]|nr:hypothetical protein [Methanomicrobiales archaeon]
PGFIRGHKDCGGGIVKVAMDLLFHTVPEPPEGIMGGKGGSHPGWKCTHKHRPCDGDPIQEYPPKGEPTSVSALPSGTAIAPRKEDQIQEIGQEVWIFPFE